MNNRQAWSVCIGDTREGVFVCVDGSLDCVYFCVSVTTWWWREHCVVVFCLKILKALFFSACKLRLKDLSNWSATRVQLCSLFLHIAQVIVSSAIESFSMSLSFLWYSVTESSVSDERGFTICNKLIEITTFATFINEFWTVITFILMSFSALNI